MTSSQELSVPPPLAVLSDPQGAASLLDPLRQKLLGALAEAPDSAAGLARRLGEPRQRLNYHLRALESAGLLELAEERRRGNCLERVMRVTARRFVVDPAALGEVAADPDQVQDRFSATFLIALAARAIRELADLRERAAEDDKRLATLSLETTVRLATPSDFDAFARDLTAAIAGVIARYHDETIPGGRPFRAVVGAYPAPGGAGEPEPKGDEQ